MARVLHTPTVVPVSVSIAAISDQTTLAAATLDSTVSGGTAPYTYAWTVNGATTGIAAATSADTTFTPTAAGRMAVALTVTDSLGATGTAARSFLVGTAALSVSIAAVSDQLTLDAITLDSTVTGGVGSKTYAWSVNGATTGLSDATAADPTFTPTGGGKHVAVCTVTDAAGQTARASVSFTVGKYVASLAKWVTLRASIDPTAEATASWLAAGATPTARVIGGYDFTSYNHNRATAFGLVNGTGVQMQNDGSASNRTTGPLLAILLQELLPGWTYGDAFVAQVQHDVADLADGAGYLGLSLCSEVPTSNAAGTYVVTGGYERVATATHKGFVDHTVGDVTAGNVSSGTTTLAGAAHGQELVCDGSGVEYGVFTSDPAGTPPDPGSSTRVPVVSGTPGDTGPVAWVTRRPGTAAENPANAYLALVTHGNNANCRRNVERLWVWA